MSNTDQHFAMYMNDMRSPKFEQLTLVATGTEDELWKLIHDETVDFYREDRPNGLWWGKRFRKGGPLEWFNKSTLEIRPAR
jgi:hypothetical protein